MISPKRACCFFLVVFLILFTVFQWKIQQKTLDSVIAEDPPLFLTNDAKVVATTQEDTFCVLVRTFSKQLQSGSLQALVFSLLAGRHSDVVIFLQPTDYRDDEDAFRKQLKERFGEINGVFISPALLSRIQQVWNVTGDYGYVPTDVLMQHLLQADTLEDALQSPKTYRYTKISHVGSFCKLILFTNGDNLYNGKHVNIYLSVCVCVSSHQFLCIQSILFLSFEMLVSIRTLWVLILFHDM